MAEEETEEPPPRENIVDPIAKLLKSDDDAQRVSGASQLKELASDPKCVSFTTAILFYFIFSFAPI